mmetsp:Transcript_11718/g.38524  ORF Transcript_11718/g.38524 Transcript_11718/m.38524 type:complete len:156 (+) Transcript_11718:182-649(+)
MEEVDNDVPAVAQLRVSKWFEESDDPEGYYPGTVKFVHWVYDEEESCSIFCVRIEYDDGDNEDVDWDELKQVLVLDSVSEELRDRIFSWKPPTEAKEVEDTHVPEHGGSKRKSDEVQQLREPDAKRVATEAVPAVAAEEEPEEEAEEEGEEEEER